MTFEGEGKKDDNGKMTTIKIADEQWRKIYKFLKAHPNTYAKQQEATRRFVEGVHWITRTGAQWRELPERYGKWNTVYKRFARWEENGVWADLHKQFAQDPDMESVIIDSTVIRAHMSAVGGSKKTATSPNKLLDAVEVDSVPKFIS